MPDRFEFLEAAVELSRFFFGEELASQVQSTGQVILPGAHEYGGSGFSIAESIRKRHSCSACLEIYVNLSRMRRMGE